MLILLSSSGKIGRPSFTLANPQAIEYKTSLLESDKRIIQFQYQNQLLCANSYTPGIETIAPTQNSDRANVKLIHLTIH
jgi:hypothetical protein